MTVTIPFPGASWNVPAADIGYEDGELRWIEKAFYEYAGGPSAPLSDVDTYFEAYSKPIYNAADPAWEPDTFVKLYANVQMRDNGNGKIRGVPIGKFIPWNFKWIPAPGNDGIMIIENYPLPTRWENGKPTTTKLVTLELWYIYDNLINGWDLFGPNNRAGFSDTFPQVRNIGDLFASATLDPRNPKNKKIVCYGAYATEGTWEPGWKPTIARGAGVDLRALVTTAEEILSGDIGHALQCTVTNSTVAPNARTQRPGIDYLPPMYRCEWSLPNALGRPSAYDPDYYHNVPHGTRLVLWNEDENRPWNDKDISLYLNRRGLISYVETAQTTTTVLRAFAKYGLIITDTGGYGKAVQFSGDTGPDKVLYKNMGIRDSRGKLIPLMKDLLNGRNLRLVKPVPAI